MTEVRFYHLQQDTTAKAVPEILGKAVSRGMTILLKVPDDKRVQYYDEWLWRFQPDSFLPHGREGDPHPEAQPIWITTSDQAPNQPKMAMVVEESEMPPVQGFELVCLVFDSENEARLQRARQLWGELKKTDGLTLTYWYQQDNGSWTKKDL